MNDFNPPDTAENGQDNRRPAVAPEEHQRVVTEGQLKWAQFHYKRRAQLVRQNVDKLWQTPASTSEVDGALSDDGNTTEESFSVADDGEEDEKSKEMLRKKLELSRENRPSISRGRRAMLRVSKRAFARRQEELRQYGFRYSDDAGSDTEDFNASEGDNALAAKYADETAWKKARRNRRQSRRRKAKSTEERLRRFENAFRAMMMSLAASQPQNPEIAAPTKVWTRPEDAPVFVSIDGRQYRDLKWGVSASNEKLAHMMTTTDFASMPVDPRASWLVHIPSKPQDRSQAGPFMPTNANGEFLVPENINGNGEKMMPIPLGSDKFNEIVGTLQEKAEMSQQQMAAQLELMRTRDNAFKWQIGQPSQAGFHPEEYHGDDGEEEDEEPLDLDDLKTIAAEYLTEFVANADEEHLIAALGEQYRDDVETLVEAASDHGQGSLVESQDIVRRYLQEMSPGSSQNVEAKQNGESITEGRENLHRSQMASFAGIAARYLAEVSRPRKVERTIKSCRQEQGVIVKELKDLLEHLYKNRSLPESKSKADPCDEQRQHRLESIIAKYAINSSTMNGYAERDVVSELRQRDGRQFLQLLGQYLASVRGAAFERHETGSGNEGNPESVNTGDVLAGFEQICLEILEATNGEDLSARSEIISVLRRESQSEISLVVSRYLEALSAAASMLNVDTSRKSNIDTLEDDYFARSRPIFIQLGTPTTTEKTNQRILEAITSRYLATIKAVGEDELFMELGKSERQGFSRLVTKYLDEITTVEGRWKDPRNKGGPAASYLDIVFSSLSSAEDVASESEQDMNQTDVENIMREYLAKVMPNRLRENFPAGERLEDIAKFSKLVSGYLFTVCESLADIERIQTSGQDGAVSRYLDSLNASLIVGTDNATSGLEPQGAVKKSQPEPASGDFTTDGRPANNKAGVASAPKRSSMNANGVASRYLSAVVDDCDDDDIFAELRKEESPKYLKSPEIQAAQQEFDTSQIQKEHKLEALEAFSPLSQSPGIPKVVVADIALDRTTAINYISRVRSDCEEMEIGTVIGNLKNRDHDRAQFGRGVTHLLMGVKEDTLRSTLNSKNSRVAASRYLAAMRGLPVEPDAENFDNFESVLVDEAAEILVECSGDGDPLALSQALRKIGKDDAERFAAFTCRYLTGTLSGNDEDDIPATLENARRDSTADHSQLETESDFFAGMRRQGIKPFKTARRLKYGPEEKEPGANHQGTEGRPSEENVLKNTFNSFSNRRDPYYYDPSEEKKSSQSLTGSSSFDNADTATSGDAENIPFDPVPSHAHNMNSPNQAYGSPNRSYATNSEFSPERLRDFHHNVMEKSALIGDGEAQQTIIDTDGTTSEASDSALSPKKIAGLLLSPTILTKRHRQAVQAIENKKWDQVQYLLSANPWLAEMPEIRTNQYLLHKIALHGGGDSRSPPAPEQLCTELVKMYPAVQKFDNSGCLPLHKASEAGNAKMIALLGDRFSSGASVRNEDGMLPLHMAILSYGDREDASSSLVDVVRSLLGYFPGALAVADNAGNLPLHLAAKGLDGDEGINVVNLLLDEGEKQLKNPYGVRFRNKVKIEEADSVDGTTTAATAFVDDNSDDQPLPSSMVVNDAGDIPLWIAIQRSAGPGIIEAFAVGPGGKLSTLKQDMSGNTALHLVLNQDIIQAAPMKSILKVAPETALEVNTNRMLPIELACFKKAAPNIVLDLVLADLPIVLSDRACRRPTGGGASLWFLACECNDRYLGVLEKLVSLCSYQQVHELAFSTRDDSRASLISCASPQCGEFLTVSLLFVGRFEFLAYAPQEVTGDVKTFDTLDYGTEENPFEEGRRVTLKCFATEEMYKKEISSLRSLELDFDYVQQVSCFVVGERDSYDSGGRQQFCAAVEQPGLTLDRVVAGMLKNDACRENTDLRRKYVFKIFSVLRIVAQALQRLHSFGVIHGNMLPEACGKFEERWKLLGSLQFQRLGDKFDSNVFGESVPPEGLEPQNSGITIDRQASFRTNITADPSIDVWGFGKLAYDVLVGEPLIQYDTSKELHQDHRSLLKVLHWSTLDLVEVRRRLREVGVPDSAVYLITKCLSPDPASRPSMTEVLRSGPWEETHRPARARETQPNNLHEC